MCVRVCFFFSSCLQWFWKMTRIFQKGHQYLTGYFSSPCGIGRCQDRTVLCTPCNDTRAPHSNLVVLLSLSIAPILFRFHFTLRVCVCLCCFSWHSFFLFLFLDGQQLKPYRFIFFSFFSVFVSTFFLFSFFPYLPFLYRFALLMKPIQRCRPPPPPPTIDANTVHTTSNDKWSKLCARDQRNQQQRQQKYLPIYI